MTIYSNVCFLFRARKERERGRKKKDICQLSTRTICLIFCLKHVCTHAYQKQPTTTSREEKKADLLSSNVEKTFKYLNIKQNIKIKELSNYRNKKE